MGNILLNKTLLSLAFSGLSCALLHFIKNILLNDVLIVLDLGAVHRVICKVASLQMWPVRQVFSKLLRSFVLAGMKHLPEVVGVQ